MPHGRRHPSVVARPLLALVVLAACTPSDEGARVPDSTATAPAASPRPAAPPPSGPAAESLAALAALRDSAAALDARFQRLRDSLNAEARALGTLERTSPEYARRYDAWVAREREALGLRARRDSLRARMGAGD